ncbi:MAG: hypothetical protein ACRCUM_00660 [Mycoplasmoidaceae bacterium]
MVRYHLYVILNILLFSKNIFLDHEGNNYENDLVIDSTVLNSNATVYQVQFTSSVGTYAKWIKVKINFIDGYTKNDNLTIELLVAYICSNTYRLVCYSNF